MDHNRQINQIATSCDRLHSEAGVVLGAKHPKQAIVNILRQSLLNVQSGYMISKPHRIAFMIY